MNEDDVPVSLPCIIQPPSPIPTELPVPVSPEPPSIQSEPLSPSTSIDSQATISSQSESCDNELEEPTDIVSQQLREIQCIFVKYSKFSRQCKDELLEYMKNLTIETQEALPKSSKTLRLKPLQHTTYSVPPGRVCYFGISYILNTSVVKLFHSKKNTISLNMNIDGVPLFRCSENGLWPILGTVDDKNVFIIGYYFGKKKTNMQ